MEVMQITLDMFGLLIQLTLPNPSIMATRSDLLTPLECPEPPYTYNTIGVDIEHFQGGLLLIRHGPLWLRHSRRIAHGGAHAADPIDERQFVSLRDPRWPPRALGNVGFHIAIM